MGILVGRGFRPVDGVAVSLKTSMFAFAKTTPCIKDATSATKIPKKDATVSSETSKKDANGLTCVAKRGIMDMLRRLYVKKKNRKNVA